MNLTDQRLRPETTGASPAGKVRIPPPPSDGSPWPPSTLVRFGWALRAAGLGVGPDEVLAFCRAVSSVRGASLYWIGRTCLVKDRSEIALYDEVFRSFFGVVQPPR